MVRLDLSGLLDMGGMLQLVCKKSANVCILARKSYISLCRSVYGCYTFCSGPVLVWHPFRRSEGRRGPSSQQGTGSCSSCGGGWLASKGVQIFQSVTGEGRFVVSWMKDVAPTLDGRQGKDRC